MKRRIFAIAATIALTACGGGGDATETPTLTISGVGITQTINQAGAYNLNMSGVGHIVNVAAGNNVVKLTMSGTNSSVTIADGATLAEVVISGIDNTVSVPKGMKPTETISGIGSRVVERP